MKNQQSYDIAGDITSKAISLAGEPAWSSDDALEVIWQLASSSLAVVGVELWQEDDGSPRWIASSDYEYDWETNWSQYVDKCSRGAAIFIERFRKEPGALFNLTWIREDEFLELQSKV